jgi:hypothetical protein
VRLRVAPRMDGARGGADERPLQIVDTATIMAGITHLRT